MISNTAKPMDQPKGAQCPQCGTKIQITAETMPVPDAPTSAAIRVSLNPLESGSVGHYNYLISCLHRYWRLVAEGKQTTGGDKRNITYDAESDRYKFHIQLFDSPMGDTWWIGKFRIGSGPSAPFLEIIEETTYRN